MLPRGHRRGRAPDRGRRRAGQPAHGGLHLPQGEAPRPPGLRAGADHDAARAHRAEGIRRLPAGVVGRGDRAGGGPDRRRAPRRRAGQRAALPLQLVGRGAGLAGAHPAAVRPAGGARGGPHDLPRPPPARRGTTPSATCSRPIRSTSRPAGSSWLGRQPDRLQHPPAPAAHRGQAQRRPAGGDRSRAGPAWPTAPTCTSPCARAPTSCSPTPWPACWRSGRGGRAVLRRPRDGVDEYLAAAREWPVARAADVCGVAASRDRGLAELVASVRPALLRIGWGPERNRNGGSSCRAILGLWVLAGHFGQRGSGIIASLGGGSTLCAERVPLGPVPDAGRHRQHEPRRRHPLRRGAGRRARPRALRPGRQPGRHGTGPTHDAAGGCPARTSSRSCTSR